MLSALNKLEAVGLMLSFAAAAIGLGTLALSSQAQGARPGLVTGVIDGVAFEGDQYYIHGWACQEGLRGSISINIYATHQAGGKPPGTYVLAGTADLPNELAVDHECHDANGGKHRFRVALPNQLLRRGRTSGDWRRE